MLNRHNLSMLLTILAIGFSPLKAQESNNKNIEANVIYGMHGGLALLMDIYKPANPNGYGIIVIPGSGFHQLMSYDATPLNKSPWYLSNIIGTDNLIENGYTLFIINHRSAPVFRFPAAVEDVQRAVQFIRRHAEKYKINKNQLGAIGHSSGAHLASMLGTLDDIKNPESENPVDKESSKVQSVVALAGLFDLTAFATSGFGDIGAITSFVGTHYPAWRSEDSPRQNEFKKYRDASPLSHISNDDASFLLVHGTNENVVPTSQSEKFHKQLLDQGIISNLIIIENGGHGLRVDGKVATDKYYAATVAHFNKELQKQ